MDGSRGCVCVGGGLQNPLKNHKLLYVSLALLVLIPFEKQISPLRSRESDLILGLLVETIDLHGLIM